MKHNKWRRVWSLSPAYQNTAAVPLLCFFFFLSFHFLNDNVPVADEAVTLSTPDTIYGRHHLSSRRCRVPRLNSLSRYLSNVSIPQRPTAGNFAGGARERVWLSARLNALWKRSKRRPCSPPAGWTHVGCCIDPMSQRRCVWQAFRSKEPSEKVMLFCTFPPVFHLYGRSFFFLPTSATGEGGGLQVMRRQDPKCRRFRIAEFKTMHLV